MKRLTNYRAECYINTNKGTEMPTMYATLGIATGSYAGSGDPMAMMFRQNPQMRAADRVRISTWES